MLAFSDTVPYCAVAALLIRFRIKPGRRAP